MCRVKLFLWFILRHLRRERLRSLLTVAGVAVGIAVVVGIRLANESSVRGFETALNAMSGQISLEVLANGIGIEDERLRALGWLREYGLVSPVIDRDVRIKPRPGARPELVRVLGIDILRDRPFREYSLLKGTERHTITTQQFLSLLTDSKAVVLTEAFARRNQLRVDSVIEMLVGDRSVEMVVKGLLAADGPAQVLSGNFALMDIAAAQLALGSLGVVDRVDIQLARDMSISETEQVIADRLQPGLIVQRPERRGAQVEKMLAAFHFNLTALSYIALLVGLFLVYNTVSVSVLTRREEIGMLRTMGTSRRTVLLLFLGEAVGLAILGCGVGVPLGWALAQTTVGLTSSTVSTFWIATAAAVPFPDAGYVALAFAIGLPLALLAAIVPAREAAGLTPVAAFRNEPDVALRKRAPWSSLGGAMALLVSGASLAMLPPVFDLPVFGLLAVLAFVFGAALLVPPLLYLCQRIRVPWRGSGWIEIGLAQANLGSSIRRVSISVAALVVSFAMMVAIAIMIGSFRETVKYWVEQTLQADLFISSARQSPVGERAVIAVDVEDEITAHPDVLAVDGFRSVDILYGESLIIVGSGRFDVMRDHGRLLFKTPADGQRALSAAIGQQSVVVSESFSLKFNRTTGDVVTLPTAWGNVPFLVTGVFYDYSTDRGLVVMDRHTFAEHYDDRRPSGLSAYLEVGADPNQVRADVLEGVGAERALYINTNASLREQVMQVFDNTFAITYALEAIAIFVSLFGVAATLLTLAVERRQQIAVLRLIGAERKHLRRMIVIEAVLLGVVSLVIGLVVGVLLSLVLIYVINVQSFGWSIQFYVPSAFLFRASILIVAGAILAGLYPAKLAARFQMANLSAES